MVRKRSDKIGLPPGALVPVEVAPAASTAMKVFVFNSARYQECTARTVADLPATEAGMVTWIDIDGLADITLLNQLRERFDLHPLLLEDVLNTEHRPKIEEYQNALFIVAKMISLHEETRELETEQISFVLGKDYVISFQERPGDVLEPIRDRIRHATGRVRRKSADYLVYALLDVIVDNYFAVVEDVGDRIEKLETGASARANNAFLLELQELRGLLIRLSRYVLPMRELAGRMNTMQVELINKDTRRYINDVQDHTVYIAESITMFRDMLANLENTCHAQINGRMAQVMRLLTVISTIFIPLTFIVGIYGMNFDHMPELHWRFGYFGVMGFMLVISVAMLLWFRRKRWL